MPPKINILKALADSFARKWAWDWRDGSKRLLNGESCNFKQIDADHCEFGTRTWSIQPQQGIIEAIEERYRISTDDSRKDCEPTGLYDAPPGEFLEGGIFSQGDLFSRDLERDVFVPDETLIQATEIYCIENKDRVTEEYVEDDYTYSLPDCSKAVKRVLKEILPRLAKEKKAADAAYKRRINRYSLTVDIDHRITIKSNKSCPDLLPFIGQGAVCLNARTNGGSSSSMLSAIRVADWVKNKRADGHKVFQIRGTFRGEKLNTENAFIVFDLSREEGVRAIRATNVGAGLYIDQRGEVEVINY